MKKAASILIVGGLVLGLSSVCGGGGGNAGSSSGSSDHRNANAEASGAKQIFEQNCSSCHGHNLKGKDGPALDHIGSKLSKKDILNQIKKGTPGKMPSGLIKGKNAEKVATWLAGMK